MTTTKIERARAHLATCMDRDDFPSHNCACNCDDVSELLAEVDRLRHANGEKVADLVATARHNERLAEALIPTVMQDISDTPPWAYTYTERPDDLLEIRASELEAILRGALGLSMPGRLRDSEVSVA